MGKINQEYLKILEDICHVSQLSGDRLDIAILERLLDKTEEGIREIKKKVWSHNPYWYAKGYDEYYFPVLLQ